MMSRIFPGTPNTLKLIFYCSNQLFSCIFSWNGPSRVLKTINWWCLSNRVKWWMLSACKHGGCLLCCQWAALCVMDELWERLNTPQCALTGESLYFCLPPNSTGSFVTSYKAASASIVLCNQYGIRVLESSARFDLRMPLQWLWNMALCLTFNI